jgi:hypothetical protein
MPLFEGFKQGLKKIKDSLTSPNVNYALELPKETFFVGEDIEGIVFLQPLEFIELQQATIRLSCVERVKKIRNVKKTRKTYDSRRDSYIISEEFVPEEYWDSAILYDRPLMFYYQPPVPIKSGEIKRMPFKIGVPLTARQTYNSIDSNVDWTLGLEVRSRGRRGLDRSYRIQVANVSVGTQAPVIQKETIREVEIIYCPYCGVKNNARSPKCISCGAKLK